LQFSIRDRKNERLGDEACGGIASEASVRAPAGSIPMVRSSAIGLTDELSGLSLEIVTTIDALAKLRGDYERLQLATGNPLPFALYEWHVAWCNQFLNVNRHIYSQPMIYLLRNRERACVAIVPLILSRRSIGPVKITSVDMLGADPAITEIRTPLVERGYNTRVAWAVQRNLAASREVDWVEWSGISGAFGEALAVGAALKWHSTVPNYVLDLPTTWEVLRAGLKRNIRESIRHCYNSLKRDGHEFEMKVAQDPDAVRDALQRFFELHALRANLDGAVAHPDHFASGVARRFLLEVCARLAQRGGVRVFQLTVAGETVAVRIGFVVGDSLYLYYSGFDPRWSKYSVMTTTVVEAIKYAISQGYRTVNLSTGTDVSKTRWGPREIQIARATQVSPSGLSRLAWNLYSRARSGRLPVTRLARWSRAIRRDWI
jgi:CelD/BcsL family acetyltransferase involved in cellulose biosynthesis